MDRYSDQEYFATGVKRNGANTRKRLIKDGHLKNMCYHCGIGPEWNGKPMNMTVEHIDGNNLNNSLENLTLICANCHTQTDTFSGRNMKVKRQPAIFKCKTCNVEKKTKSPQCKKCAGAGRYKIDWPDREQLRNLVKSTSYTSVGKLLGVSDNAVRKHLSNAE